MVVGLALIIVSLVVIAIWVVIEVKRVQHKVWAIFLIAIVLFGYISFTMTLKSQDIDYKSASGLMQATKIYFSWLGHIIFNLKDLTGDAIDKDWSISNKSTQKPK